MTDQLDGVRVAAEAWHEAVAAEARSRTARDDAIRRQVVNWVVHHSGEVTASPE